MIKLCFCYMKPSTITTIFQFVETLDDNHAAVRVGAAATNLEMVKWSTNHGWTLPMDIIAVMITYGGSNATITHGAGINNKNLNDIVLKLESIVIIKLFTRLIF